MLLLLVLQGDAAEMPASKFRGLVSAMYPFFVSAISLLLLVAEDTAVVDESGKTWQLLSNAWCKLYLLSLLAAVSRTTGGSSF